VHLTGCGYDDIIIIISVIIRIILFANAKYKQKYKPNELTVLAGQQGSMCTNSCPKTQRNQQ